MNDSEVYTSGSIICGSSCGSNGRDFVQLKLVSDVLDYLGGDWTLLFDVAVDKRVLA